MLAQLGMVTMALVIHRKFNKACKACLHVWSIITPAQQGCLTDTQMVDGKNNALLSGLELNKIVINDVRFGIRLRSGHTLQSTMHSPWRSK